MNRQAQFSLHPLVAAAAVSLVVVSGLGVAALMGLLPPDQAPSFSPSVPRVVSSAAVPGQHAAVSLTAVANVAATPAKAALRHDEPGQTAAPAASRRDEPVQTAEKPAPDHDASVQAVAKALALDVP